MTDKSQLSAETLKQLQAAAARRGKTPDALVVEFIRQSEYVEQIDAKWRSCVIRESHNNVAAKPRFHNTRSDSGSPSAAILFNTAHLVLASTCWFSSVRADSLPPSIVLNR